MQMAGVDNDDNNILVAQAFLASEERKSLLWFFAVALPHLIGQYQRLITTVCMDEDADAWAAVRTCVTRRLFHTDMTIIPCAYHKLFQALERPHNFGRGDVRPAVYTLIRNCLDDLSQYCETKTEAAQTIESLRLFAKSNLSAAKAALLEAFIGKLEGSLSLWAFYGRLRCLTMGQRTSNRCTCVVRSCGTNNLCRVEVENAIVKGRKGVAGLNARSGLHLAVDLMGSVMEKRAHKLGIERHRHMSTQSIHTCDAPLRLARKHLTHHFYTHLAEQYDAHVQYDYVQKECGGFYVSLNAHWLLRAKVRAVTQSARRIGPTFLRERLVRLVSCESCTSQHYFLQCSCALYQRILVPCRHIWCVKQGTLVLPEDDRDHFPYFRTFTSVIGKLLLS